MSFDIRTRFDGQAAPVAAWDFFETSLPSAAAAPVRSR